MNVSTPTRVPVSTPNTPTPTNGQHLCGVVRMSEATIVNTKPTDKKGNPRPFSFFKLMVHLPIDNEENGAEGFNISSKCASLPLPRGFDPTKLPLKVIAYLLLPPGYEPSYERPPQLLGIESLNGEPLLEKIPGRKYTVTGPIIPDHGYI